MQGAFALVIVISVLTISAFAGTCTDTFKDFEYQLNVTDACMVKLNLTMMDLDLDGGQWEEVTPGYDDKCLSKCFWTDMKLMSPSGVVKKDEVGAYMEGQGPKELITLLMPAVNKCIDTYARALGARGGEKPNLCDLSYKLNVCFNKGYKEIC